MMVRQRPPLKMPGISHKGGAGRGAAIFAPAQGPKRGPETLRRILRIYMRQGAAVLAVVLLTLAAAGVAAAIPYCVGRTFDSFRLETGAVDARSLQAALAILAALYAVNWLVATLNGVVTLKLSQQLVFVLRAAFFAKMQKLPLSFYDTRPHGDTMSRLTNDIDNISSAAAQTTAQLLAGALTLVGSLAVMFALSAPLTLVVLAGVPLTIFLIRLIARRSRVYFLARQRCLGEINAITEEAILGLKMIRAFGRQDDIVAKFTRINERLYQSGRRAQTWAGFMMPLSNVINNLVFALVALAGSLLSIGYGLPVGTVVSFMSYSKQVAQPLHGLAGMFNAIQAALAGAERVFEILDQAEEPADDADAAALENVRGAVTFENVSFSYGSGVPVLRDVSFTVRAGETVALVGETGAGKTTLVQLLTRFYDADGGCIRIDGMDVRKIKRDSLRRCFSVVLQDTCLFTGAILDNILYARPGATRRQAVAAARLARAHSFIEKLPRGYQTMVSGDADTLSQGQRQLLAIARAVLSDSPILILDEATSSVDTATEREIQRAMLGLKRNRTCFLIAHRLSTIRGADRIMVVGDGRILENGSHAALMAARGPYYRMATSQLGRPGAPPAGD